MADAKCETQFLLFITAMETVIGNNRLLIDGVFKFLYDQKHPQHVMSFSTDSAETNSTDQAPKPITSFTHF